MEQYFRRLTEMAEDKNHPARIRFMLTDLIDMRKNGYPAPQSRSAKPGGATLVWGRALTLTPHQLGGSGRR
jgi:hypothetical protein